MASLIIAWCLSSCCSPSRPRMDPWLCCRHLRKLPERVVRERLLESHECLSRSRLGAGEKPCSPMLIDAISRRFLQDSCVKQSQEFWITAGRVEVSQPEEC